MAKLWTKNYELEFWQGNPKDWHLERIYKKYELFDVDNYFSQPVELAVDVGGGKYGGALYWFKKARKKMLVDKLAAIFRAMNSVPEDISIIDADFDNLPLANDSVDALFAWQVLDHALNKEHFKKGQDELLRVLKPGGYLFFQQPLFDKPHDGHTVAMPRDEIMKGFSALTIIKEHECRNSIAVVWTKNLAY